MTRVVFQQAAADKVYSAEELVRHYTGFGGGDENLKLGGETERVYYQEDNPEHIMTSEQQAEFVRQIRELKITDPATGKKTKEVGHDLETSSQVIEEQTSAVQFEDVGKMLDQEREIAAHMSRIAEGMGVRQSPFTNNPFATHDQLFRNPVAEPRHRTDMLMQAFYQNMGHDALSYTFLTSPVHCSLSYNNPDELWDMSRRMYYLTPFMYLASDNSGNFMENCPVPLNHHFTMRTNQALGQRGGVPDYFYKSECGEDMIRGHLQAVLDNPMVIEFDENGNEYTPAMGRFRTPSEVIAEQGHIDRCAFDLAESTLWPDGKICNIRNSENIPVGKRFEVRMWDSGPHQFASMALTCAALFMDREGGRQCDELLKDFGFGDKPADSEEIHREAMRNALYHGGRFMDIPFGAQKSSSGEQPGLLDFSRELAPIIRQSIERLDRTQLSRLEPLENICKTGETDTKVAYEHYKTLEGLKGFMQDYPEDLFTRPDGTSFHMLREGGELPSVRTSRKVMAPIAAIG